MNKTLVLVSILFGVLSLTFIALLINNDKKMISSSVVVGGPVIAPSINLSK